MPSIRVHDRRLGKTVTLPVPEKMLSRTYILDGGLEVTAEEILAARTTIPPAWFVLHILAPELAGESDYHRQRGVVSVTQALGCPREPALARLGASPVKLNNYVAMSVGTTIHQALAHVDVELDESCQLITEGVDDTRLEGVIDGVRVVGTFDGALVKPDKTILFDYKIRNPNARRFAGERKDWAQAALYAELFRQTFGDRYPPVSRVDVYTCYFYEWLVESYQPVPIQDVLEALPPTGGTRTIRELLHEADKASRLMEIRDVLKTVPPVGQEMFGGKKCSLYCPFYHVCWPEEANRL